MAYNTVGTLAALLSGSGTLGNPSYSFSADATTGMWLNGAGVLEFSASGVNALQFSQFNLNVGVAIGNTNGVSLSNDPQSTSYAVNTYDLFIPLDTVTNTITVTLPSGPTGGRLLIIKDATGHAATHNITIAGNGKNIDGAASLVISANFGVSRIIYNSTQWSIC